MNRIMTITAIDNAHPHTTCQPGDVLRVERQASLCSDYTSVFVQGDLPSANAGLRTFRLGSHAAVGQIHRHQVN
jgi:hypothetical protein